MLAMLFSDSDTAALPTRWKDHPAVSEWIGRCIAAQHEREDAEQALSDLHAEKKALRDRLASEQATAAERRALRMKVRSASRRVEDAKDTLGDAMLAEAEVRAEEGEVYREAAAEIAPALRAKAAAALQKYIDGLNAFMDGYDALHAVHARYVNLNDRVKWGQGTPDARLCRPYNLESVPSVSNKDVDGMRDLTRNLERCLSEIQATL
jgi:hypothetical protein